MATDISEIEDGFALRHGVRKKKTKPKFKDECTIPPALPKHVLSTLVMFSPRSKKAIADYVEVQAREKVLHTEKIKTEHVMRDDSDAGTARQQSWNLLVDCLARTYHKASLLAQLQKHGKEFVFLCRQPRPHTAQWFLHDE